MTRRTTETDRLVGTRVRLRRQELGMSQTSLAQKLGITFQQVQKYEHGTNRVGASRLAAVAEALQVPVGYFFEDLPGAADAPAERDELTSALHQRGAAELLRAYAAIADQHVRRRLLDLTRSLAGQPSAEAAE